MDVRGKFSDVGHFEEPRVQLGLGYAFLEGWFVESGGAAGYYYAVELGVLDCCDYLVLALVAAGVVHVFCVDDVGQGLCVFC